LPTRPSADPRPARPAAARPALPARAALGSLDGGGGGQRCALARLCLGRARHPGLLAGGRGGDAMAEFGYHIQAARGRRGRTEQPRAGADDNAGTHAARVADAALSASKGRVKETAGRRPANTRIFRAERRARVTSCPWHSYCWSRTTPLGGPSSGPSPSAATP